MNRKLLPEVFILGLAVTALIAVAPRTGGVGLGPGGPEAGQWIFLGHPGCGTNSVCVDWLTWEGKTTHTCCLDIKLQGSRDFYDCADFRAPHGAGASSQHVAEP
ncbi:MAG: hypothetical protein AAF604_12760 [Acidobacteriota bacterium]